ncbi:MAG: phosphoglycerate kinase [Gammaproteobacteria bacterium]|nr:phosphoglycerate kinase [Gammaproteobacteria bacterium]
MSYVKLKDIQLNQKRVIIREDLNVPIKDGIITSEQRLDASLPTLRYALEANAAVLLLSHLGRPQEGKFDPKYSLKPVADYLAQLLPYPVRFESNYLDGVELRPGELVIGENVRFNVGEKANDAELSKKLAKLGDVFVMDAFGTAHRAHASTCGIAQFSKIAVAGPLLVKELDALEDVMKNPKHPVIAVVGGAKVSSKLTLLRKLIEQVDVLILGGGIANTFLKAQGFEIGQSLCEDDLVAEAKDLIEFAKQHACEIPLPVDVVVGKYFGESCAAFNKNLSQIANDDLIFDIGPETIHCYVEKIHQAQTIIWNGPVGVFEFPQFAYGTRALAIAIANSNAFSVAGGGDTLAAIDQYDLKDEISYVSTGGGAFLAYLEGEPLPAVAALHKKQVIIA